MWRRSTETVSDSTGVPSGTLRPNDTVRRSGMGLSKVRPMSIALWGLGLASSKAVRAFNRPYPYLGLCPEAS